MNRFANSFSLCGVFVLMAISGCRSRGHSDLASYDSKDKTHRLFQSCLLWADDIRTSEDIEWIQGKFGPAFLVRSWYRWGLPRPEKAYEARKSFVEVSEKQGFSIGGGGSLSVVHDRDLALPGFDKSWLAVDLNGIPIDKGAGFKLGSLSVPGFRSYLIGEAMKQVQAGVRELHFGETNGAIYFDDWTIGIRGQSGYFQWLVGKFGDLSVKDWTARFGAFGERVRIGRFPTRSELLSGSDAEIKKLFSVFGKPGSWKGNTDSGASGFLSEKYAENLSAFLEELRSQLKNAGREDVLVSIWGVPPWYVHIKSKPDFIITSPPDERWGMPWASDPKFDFAASRSRIVDILRQDVRTVAPVPLVIAIDHPHPWVEFVRLSDERQAQFWGIWKGIADEIGSLLFLRSYSQERSQLGPKTLAEIRSLCQKS